MSSLEVSASLRSYQPWHTTVENQLGSPASFSYRQGPAPWVPMLRCGPRPGPVYKGGRVTRQGHFSLGFFASWIGRSEMECSALGFSYVRGKPRNGQLAKMSSFHRSKRSDNKWYAVEGEVFLLRIRRTFLIPYSGRKYSHTNSYNSATTVIA